MIVLAIVIKAAYRVIDYAYEHREAEHDLHKYVCYINLNRMYNHSPRFCVAWARSAARVEPGAVPA